MTHMTELTTAGFSRRFRKAAGPARVVVRAGIACMLLAGVLLAGCSSRSLTRAPVEDRGTANRPSVGSPVAVDAGVKQPPGFENAGKPGYYTVKPGDTMIRIGLDTGQNWRDIVRWNNLENPNLIEVGQVLRVAPPTSDRAVAITRPVTSGVTSANPSTTALPPLPASSAERAATVPGNGNPPPQSAEDEMSFLWPAQGPLIAGFDEVKNKGFDIAGKAGDPIIASADGRVVYAGAGLRGYGNLIILKHNNTFLTAYAHNQTLLVKEDQSVRKGQKIAEMGSSDTDKVKLHFEVRRQGKPVDPAKYLPAR